MLEQYYMLIHHKSNGDVVYIDDFDSREAARATANKIAGGSVAWGNQWYLSEWGNAPTGEDTYIFEVICISKEVPTQAYLLLKHDSGTSLTVLTDVDGSLALCIDFDDNRLAINLSTDELNMLEDVIKEHREY